MIHHILLFRFKKDMPLSKRDEIFRKFEFCKSRLDGFIEIQHGKNISIKQHLSGGFNYGAIMTFRDESAIAQYNTMKEHIDAQNIQKPYLEEVLVFDILQD